MVTYLSGGRIQGSSTAGAEARKYTIATDYSTTVSATNLASDNTDWVRSDTTNTDYASDRLNMVFDSSQDVVYYDLQNANALGSGNNASDTAWTLRWTHNNTSKGTTTHGYIGLSSTTTDAGEDQDQIAFYINHPTPSNEKKYGCHDVEGSDPDSTNFGNSNGWDPSEGYTYYFELTRTSATAYAIRKYTDSDYDTLDQSEITGSCAATLNNLRYIKLTGSAASDSTLSFKFDDVKFWNGITSSTTAEPADANIAGTDEKATITNVPIGTRYEETDTRKIFRRKVGGEAQANNVFNATNYTWVTAGNSGNTITTGDDGTGQGVSAGGLSSYRRGKTTITSGNTKTFVWKFTWSRNSGDQANNSILTLANFDWADTTPSGDQKNIKFQTSNTDVGFWRVQTASASVTSTQNSDFLQAAGTTRYYTVTGDGTNWKAQSWSDSARTTDEETTGDLGFPSDWLTTDPINNITFGSFGTASSDFTVKDISVKWDSGTAETWVEKGTA